MSTILLDRCIFDTLMPDLVGHERRPSAFLVYLAIVNAAVTGSVHLTHGDLAERTELSKREVQSSVAWLVNRRLISASRTGVTSVNRYVPHQPWRPLAGQPKR
jgi:transcription initiation factor IIE alpha subunit